MRLPAWRALSASAVALLVEIMAAYRPAAGNLIVLSDRKTAQLARCARARAHVVLLELVEHGWLQVERVGGGMRGPADRRSAAYSLTMFDTDDAPARRLFERWKPRDNEVT